MLEKSPWEILDTLRTGAEVEVAILYDLTARRLIRSEITENLVALANTPTGGFWFVGVEGPATWKNFGVELPDDFEDDVRAAARKIEPPTADVRIERRGTVTSVSVVGASGRSGSYHVRGGATEHRTYVYDGGHVRKAQPNEIKELRDRAGESQFELETITGQRTSDLHGGLLAVAGIDLDEPKAFQNADVTDSYGLPTVGGLIAFGKGDVFRRYPDMGIRWRRYRHGATEQEIHGLDPTEDESLEGTISDMIDTVVDRIVEWLPTSARLRDAERLATELIVNAVAHRSLSPFRIGNAPTEGAAAAVRLYEATQGFVGPSAEPVNVECFLDLIRITNPGPLPVGRVRQIGPDTVKGRLARNPRLLELLTRRGLASGRGLGLAFARRMAPLVGCRLELENHTDSFEVRLRIDPDRVVDVSRGTAGVPPKRRRLTPAERQEAIVSALEEGSMTAAELVGQLGWPASTVRHVLRALLKQGTVKRTARSPRSPNQSYRLS